MCFELIFLSLPLSRSPCSKVLLLYALHSTPNLVSCHFFSCLLLLLLIIRFPCSLKLIRGSLDQVEQKAQITWVQPRVLSREQIGDFAKRLEEWVAKLNKVEQKIAPEVLVGA